MTHSKDSKRRFSAFRSAAEEAAAKRQTQNRDNEGGHMSSMAGRVVGTVTTVARHHELGPVALAVVKRSAPVDATLVVDCEGGAVAAGQEEIVPGEGLSVDRPAPRGPVTRGLGVHPSL